MYEKPYKLLCDISQIEHLDYKHLLLWYRSLFFYNQNIADVAQSIGIYFYYSLVKCFDVIVI